MQQHCLGIGVLLLLMIAACQGSPRGYRYDQYASALLSRHRRATDECGKYCSGSCVNPPLRCNSCPKDHTFNGQNCLPCPVNCQRCKPNSEDDTQGGQKPTLCEKCDEGFRLSDTDSTVCEACHVDDRHTCTSCDTNGAGKCDPGTCIDGFAYSPNDMLCFKCADHCLSCPSPGTCHSTKCEAGYVYENSTDTCRQCAEGCHWCNATGANKCDTDRCRPGYAYKNERCDGCPTNCHNCTYKAVGDAQVNMCDACREGYVPNPNTGKCDVCPANCDTCEFDTTENKAACRKCLPYWTVNSNLECQRCQYREYQTPEGLTVLTKYCKLCDTHGVDKCDQGETDNPCEGSNLGYNSNKHICEGCPAYCKKCRYSAALDKLVCLDDECVTGYGYMVDTGACARCVDYCMSCAIGETCSSGQCQLGFSLVNGECIDCSLGCQECSEPQTCTQCQSGYAFVPNEPGATQGTCRACPRRCKICEWNSETEMTHCTVCSANNALYGQNINTCDACPTKCSRCHVKSDGRVHCYADSCMDGTVYNSVEGGCIDCVDNCLQCQQQSTSEGKAVCAVCQEGYAKTSEGMCVLCSPNCVACTQASDGTTTCTTCVTGYRRDAGTGDCVKCPENCLYSACTIAGGVTSCSSCVGRYTVQNGQCAPCGANCNACDFIDNAVKCLPNQCEGGTALHPNGNCDPCDVGCETCHYEGSTKVCDRCSVGYSDNGYGGCLQCSPNCISCSQAAGESIMCDQQGCQTGAYYVDASLSSATFPQGSCQSCGPGCDKCRTSEYCEMCALTHARNPNIPSSCVACPNCVDGQCGWTLGEGAPTCGECLPGHGHNLQQVCVACPAGCSTCSPDDNNIMLCDSCMAGYAEMLNHQCILCPHGCAGCSMSGAAVTCNACILGYVAVGQLCISCGSNCDECDFDSATAKVTCNECSTGYVTDANGMCTDCAPGFGQQSGKCARCPSSCSSCATASMCDTCNSGYAVDLTGKCTDCLQANCQRCASGSPTQCEVCNNGYVLTSAGQCVACDSACQHCSYNTADATTTCLPFQCKAGRVMGDNNVCISCGLGCAACKLSETSFNLAGKCMRCKRGYVKDHNTKVCHACPPGCSLCSLLQDGTTTCLANPCSNTPAQSWDSVTRTCTDSTCPADCDKCSTPSACDPDGCADGKYNYQGSCITCAERCTACTVALECNPSACKLGSWYNAATRKCKECTSNCFKCEDSAVGECDTDGCPSAGFYYGSTNKECGACHASCATCTGQLETRCTSCAEKYYTDTTTDPGKTLCPACHDRCGTCTGGTDQDCVTCTTGYYLVNTQGQITCPACTTVFGAECQECSPDACTKCDVGFGPDAAGSCTACVGNCNQCSITSTKCDPHGCATSFKWKTGGTCVDACEYYNADDETCVERPLGYLAIQTYIANGKAYSPGPQYCEAGYVWKANQCIDCALGNCHIGNDEQVVVRETGCGTGFKRLADGACAGCSDNCFVCDIRGAGKCDDNQCMTGYFLSSHENAFDCIACGDHCKSCQEAGTAGQMECDEGMCEGGYIKALSGLCHMCPTFGGCVCEASANSATCSSCGPGYYLDTTDGLCYSCPKKCALCTYHAEIAGPICTTCAANAHTNGDGTRVCYACYEGCSNCQYEGESGYLECTQDNCNTGYTVADSGACFKCPTSCGSCGLNDYEMQAECMMCSAAYLYKDTDNTCVGCAAGCKAGQCQSEDTCSADKCQDGFARDGTGLCHACVNCAECTASGGETSCTGPCNRGYFKNAASDCVSCPSRCDYCDNSNTCRPQGCASGYSIDDNSVCQSCGQMEGCDQCVIVNNAVQCYQCSSSYFLSGTECKPCAPNCHGCSVENQCNSGACNDEFAFNSADKTCIACPPDCDNCMAQNGGTVCMEGQCKASYGPTVPGVEGNCGQCADHCSTCHERGAGKCDSCTNCHTCTGSAESHCDSLFGLATDFTCGTCADNCEGCACSGSGKCDVCMAGYARDPNSAMCFLCSPNCAICQYVMPAGASEGVTECSVCHSGYILNPGTKTCVSCPDACTDCTFNSLSDTDSSQPVTRCNSNACIYQHVYRAGDSACPACPSNCNDCSVNATTGRTMCKATGCYASNAWSCCKEGYGLVNSDQSCNACPQDCRFCHDVGQGEMECDQCDTGYTANTEECRPCIEHCSTCSKNGYNGQICHACEESPHEWVLVDGATCQPCVDNCDMCEEVNGQVQCEDENCDDHYAKNSAGQCEACSTLAYAGCSKCSDVDGDGKSKCTECMAGYTFNETKTACIQCPASCRGNCADHTYACSACEDGKHFNDAHTDCGFTCYHCMGDGCLKTSDNYNETEVFCSTSCYARNTTSGGKSTYEKGCFLMDTCNDECRDRDNKKTRQCTQCCQGDHCNDRLAASAVSVSLNFGLLVAVVIASVLGSKMAAKI